TGQCSATASLSTNTPAGNFINLDVPPNCSGNACQAGDVCGDITGPLNTAHNPLFVTQTITAPCSDADNNQKLDLPFCTTWRQPGSNQVCLGIGNGTTTNDVFPGSPSKCNCGVLSIPIQPVNPNVSVTKACTTVDTPGNTNTACTLSPEGGQVT